jgi:uncharacterized repeat protein (TIGR01451 family)
MKRSASIISSSILVLAALNTGLATATVDPPTATLTIPAGSSGTETKTVGVPEVPPAADIELAIDTTGSMGPSIAQAKADAIAIVTGVQAAIPDAQFAVVGFKDSFDVPEYQVLQSMTGSAADVQSAVNLLSASGGGDLPEAYNLVYHNSYTPALGGDIGWRGGTRKFVIVIGDAEPHGARTAGFSDCADSSADPNGLNTATELSGMNVNQRTLFMILQTSSASTTLACYQQLAAAAFTGSAGVAGGTDLATQIVDLINAATTSVSDVHLEVASVTPSPADASWISFDPTVSGPVTPPADLNFTLTATVPPGTPAGTYAFDIVARADGADIGHQSLTVVVGGTPEPGADLSVAKHDSPDPVRRGKKLTYTMRVVNLGPSDSTNVMLEDKLPRGVRFLSAVASQGNCSRVGRSITCQLESIAGADSATVRVEVRPNTCGPKTNRVLVMASESDPELTNNSARSVTKVIRCADDDDDDDDDDDRSASSGDGLAPQG